MPVQTDDAGREEVDGCCAAGVLESGPRVPGQRRSAATFRCRRATDAELRQAYFSQAGLVIARYGVSFERVLEHLRSARARHPHLAVPVVRHMDDLVHAVACVDGYDSAWRDLAEAHERGLVRACREWLDGADAIILVRRLFAELRRQVPGIQPLRSYDGTCPLRKWLGDRAIGRLNQVDGGFARFRDDWAGPGGGQARRPAEARRPLSDGHFLEGDVIWRANDPGAFAAFAALARHDHPSAAHPPWRILDNPAPATYV